MTHPTTAWQTWLSEPLRWATRRWLRVAVTLSFAAEALHLCVAPAQYAIFFLYGGFFLVAAALQGLTGILLLFAPGPRVLRWTTRLNAFLVGSYVFAHTVGVIIGIGFMRLPVDAPGVLVTLLELAIVAAMVIVRQRLAATATRQAMVA